MKVPFLDLKKLHASIQTELSEAVASVVDSGPYIGGSPVTAFEKSFAEWVGPNNFCVGVANGTDAITIAAKALQLEKGSEAIVPAMTYAATVSALLHAGLEVKLVDISPATYTIDTTLLESILSEKTALLVPVHLYGQMADMPVLKSIADKGRLKILEDAAQSHGSLLGGKPVGHYGDIATYSFYPGKNLGALGDAGAILSRDLALIERCRALGNQGGLVKYQHDYVGYNSRLDTLQAAILSTKLRKLSEWNERRSQIARTYREMLGGIPGLELPTEIAGSKHTYHLYVVRVEDRESFIAHLKKHEIDTGIHYPRAIHQQPAFRNLAFASQKYPVAENLAEHGVSLPICPTIGLDALEWIGKTVRSYFGGHR